jgi:hypothetical protein
MAPKDDLGGYSQKKLSAQECKRIERELENRKLIGNVAQTGMTLYSNLSLTVG